MKRKLIDDRGRIFGIISIIDIIVIAILIVLAAAVYMRFFTNDTTATAVVNDVFSYEIKVFGVRDLTIDAISVGDALYEKEGAFLGTVSDIKIEDHEKDLVLLDGSIVMAPVENRYNIILTVDSTGVISNGRYYASRTYEISANQSVSFYSKYVNSAGVIWSVL